MVGPLQSPAAQNSIPISTSAGDSNHPAHRIKTANSQINGHDTHFLVQPFADRIFVLVTQVQKMGTAISAVKETAFGGAHAFQVSVLLGKRDVPELMLCARQIVQAMDADGCSRPLLLSIALNDHSIDTIRQVVEKVKGLRVW